MLSGRHPLLPKSLTINLNCVNFFVTISECRKFFVTEGDWPVHKRWMVERTFAWFDNNRRLYRNYELLMESSQEMVKISHQDN